MLCSLVVTELSSRSAPRQPNWGEARRAGPKARLAVRILRDSTRFLKPTAIGWRVSGNSKAHLKARNLRCPESRVRGRQSTSGTLALLRKNRKICKP